MSSADTSESSFTRKRRKSTSSGTKAESEESPSEINKPSTQTFSSLRVVYLFEQPSFDHSIVSKLAFGAGFLVISTRPTISFNHEHLSSSKPVSNDCIYLVYHYQLLRTRSRSASNHRQRRQHLSIINWIRTFPTRIGFTSGSVEWSVYSVTEEAFQIQGQVSAMDQSREAAP